VREFTVEAFDEIISGTTSAWYTPAQFNDQLGSVDGLTLHAVTTDVTGSFPTLTCGVETSANGMDWIAYGSTPAINGVSIASGDVKEGVHGFMSFFLRFVRVKITLQGSSPKCRLRLHITGRTAARAREAQAMQANGTTAAPRTAQGQAMAGMPGAARR
jgi:hypothetical protein